MENKLKQIPLIFLIVFLPSVLFAISVEDYIDKSQCDQIVEKQLYQICYSYKYKGALSGWLRLDGKLVDSARDIKKRPKFYNEKTIPMKYRTKYKDYTGYGKDWNRGHFIVADADLDYDAKALNKAYTMANIIPQSATVNQRTWIKCENYGRLLASKLGYINSISIAKYDNPNQKIGNNIVIPTKLYRIYYNNDAKFEKCFVYENELNVDYKNDKLKDHEIYCESLKLK
jgi:endonuclease G, mitochondrial